MKNLKRFLALGLAAAMAVSVAACGNSSSSSSSSSSGNNNPTEAQPGNNDETKPGNTNEGGKRELLIGSWWVQYYDSTHTSLEDDPSYKGDDLAAELKFENVKKIENKYNVTFKWVNLTYEGTKESINNSILAGAPDCDIYLVDLSMALPAQVNGLCTDLKDVLPADSDIFTDKIVDTYIDMGDGKACIIKRNEAQSIVEATYPLAFNKQILDNAGLEDPRELYKKGEWTWAKFEEYLKTLHNDSAGANSIYGFGGFPTDTFEALMFSNGGEIAATPEQHATTAPVGEALEELQKIFQNWSVKYEPEDLGNADKMRFRYRDGDVAFWPSAAWIASSNGDYDADNPDKNVQFDTVFCHWPVGPSGDQNTNSMKNATSGEFYIIPSGVKDPELVYNVLYDMWNWYDFDTEKRDDRGTLWWWYGSHAKDETLQVENFDCMFDMGSHAMVDNWQNLGWYYDFTSLITGEMTPAQWQETYKQQIQDALDNIFKN